MKHLKLSLITFAILISGCGGGNSSSSTPDSPTGSGAGDSHETKTVAEAEKNLSVLYFFDLEDISSNSVSSNSKVLKKAITLKVTNQKTITTNCSNGGTQTITISDDQKTRKISLNHCKEDNIETDGEMTIVYKNDGKNVNITYNELTIIDEEGTRYINLTMNTDLDNSTQIGTFSLNGVMNQTLKSGEKNNITFTNFVTKEKDTASESWSTIDGTITAESKCNTGTYTFKTIEKLVDATDGSDNAESGILKLNGATYTFENPYVTIKAGTQEETIKQSELEKRMSSACAI